MNKDIGIIIISRDAMFDKKLYLVPHTKVQWYDGFKNKTYITFNLSFLIPISISLVNN